MNKKAPVVLTSACFKYGPILEIRQSDYLLDNFWHRLYSHIVAIFKPKPFWG